MWEGVEQNCQVPLVSEPLMSWKEWKNLIRKNEWVEKRWKVWSKIKKKLKIIELTFISWTYPYP